MSQQLQKVGLQKVGVLLLEKAVNLCGEDDKVCDDLKIPPVNPDCDDPIPLLASCSGHI